MFRIIRTVDWGCRKESHVHACRNTFQECVNILESIEPRKPFENAKVSLTRTENGTKVHYGIRKAGTTGSNP